MRLPILPSLLILAGLPLLLSLNACSVTSEATEVPFDLASTSGEASTSSSSSGDDEADAKTAARERFVASQIDWLRRDAARGQGESLDALAVLLGEPDSLAFGQWTQTHYAQLFTNLEQPSELLARISDYR